MNDCRLEMNGRMVFRKNHYKKLYHHREVDPDKRKVWKQITLIELQLEARIKEGRRGATQKL